MGTILDQSINDRDYKCYEQSIKALKEKDYQAAIIWNDQISHTEINQSIKLEIRAGHIYLEACEWHDAVDRFNKALKLNRDETNIYRRINYEVMAYLGRIYAFMQENRIDDIKKDLKKLVIPLSTVFEEERKDGIRQQIGADLVGFWFSLGFSRHDFFGDYFTESLKYLYDDIEKYSDDSNDKAWLFLIVEQLTYTWNCYDAFERQEELQDNFFLKVIRKCLSMTKHPAMKVLARREVNEIFSEEKIKRNGEPSKEQVQLALEIDPGNPYLSTYRKGFQVRIVNSTVNPITRQSPFFSSSEYRVWKILSSALPGFFIIPNVSLQLLLRYEEMKPLLSEEDFRYYLQSLADFVIYSLPDLRPLVVIELDSIYHDEDEAKERDRKKNLFFRMADLPFVRLRNPNYLSDHEIFLEIKKVLKGLGLDF